MPKRRAPEARKARRSAPMSALALATLPDPDGAGQSAPRPPIWVDGRQAPAFDLRVYAEAGMLLTRDAAETGLIWLSSEASALSARVERQDWSAVLSRLGRLGRALPGPDRTSAALDRSALHAQAARRLLFGLPDPVEAEPDATPVAAPPRVQPQRPPRREAASEPMALADALIAAALEPVAAPAPEPAPDPDLAAIRALMADQPAEPPAPRPVRAQARPDSSVPQPETPAPQIPRKSRNLRLPPVVAQALTWTGIRVLAGTALVFATPVGFGRALYRHLDGQDLKEIVTDCRRPRAN